jgi:hypothetical protein
VGEIRRPDPHPVAVGGLRDAADVSLSDDLLAGLDEATADLKDSVGSNPDPWQSDSRYR